jgi:hypothetical protein
VFHAELFGGDAGPVVEGSKKDIPYREYDPVVLRFFYRSAMMIAVGLGANEQIVQPACPDVERTQKTKKFLAEALKELILEKGYDSVTIQDIIDRANVGRSTFYAHYENKEQLMVGNIHFQQALVDPPATGEVYPMGINLAYLFNHTKEHLPLVRGIAGTQGMTALLTYFTELCAAKIVDYHKGNLPRSKLGQRLFKYRAEAAAGGIVRMLLKWLEEGAVVPTEEMVRCAGQVLAVVVSVDG